jgi:exodeoxyribonuclease V gamma subunit
VTEADKSIYNHSLRESLATEFLSLGHGILLFGSNDPKELIQSCAEQLTMMPGDPFKEEEFVVQSSGMGTWIRLEMADNLGIFANARFRFPEETIWMIVKGLLGTGPDKNPYTKEGMTWRIYDLLPKLLETEKLAFEPVIYYLNSDTRFTGVNADRAFRLSRQIATLFDSYLTYRPEMILDWQNGKLPAGNEKWQGILWKSLRSAFEEKSLPELVLEIKDIEQPLGEEWLPDRLSVFGICTLPPIFLDIFKAYGRFRSLRFYALQPAPVMWGDIQSGKTLEKWKSRAIERAKSISGITIDEQSLGEERGNPLIGSLGRLGRDFFNLLVDRDAHDFPLKFRKPLGDSLLARLQRWTFEVFTENPEERKNFSKSDHSITINSCHGPMREVEVLRDFLLHRFAEDPTLQPKDVLVMMPDTELYAPYIRATFEAMGKEMPEKFPFSIVDRLPRQESNLVDYFFDLLELLESRVSNREILDLLDANPLREKFGLEQDDIDAYRIWIRDCNAYWGLSGEHRARFGSVNTNEHTWLHAMDRMALGFCMRSNGNRVWGETMPFDEIEGQNALRFGKLFKVIDLLSKFEKDSAKEKNLLNWTGFLNEIINEFFPSDNHTLLDRNRIQKAVNDLKILYSPLAENTSVPLQVIRYHLSNVIEAGTNRGKFLRSGVTFCGLRPMRSVNAKIICLIGMNDGAFPRQGLKHGFDLSGDRRPGDRSVRDDDRYLFLESIWCARDFLYLSYVGQSIHHNQKIPPSLVINELLDGIDKLVEFDQTDQGGAAVGVREMMINHHTLQPFAEENFKGEKLQRSFSLNNLQAAEVLSESRDEIPPFINEKIVGPEEGITELSLEQLVRFIENPPQYFLKFRMGMNLWDEDAPPEESEPFELGFLQRYKLKDRLLQLSLESKENIDLLAMGRAEGLLPPGNLGLSCFNEVCREVDEFVEKWGAELTGKREDPIIKKLEFSGISLIGELLPFVNGMQVLFRCVKEIKCKDRLRAWVLHLFSSACGNHAETRFYTSDSTCLRLKPMDVEEASNEIEKLVLLYQRGLTEPLSFFAESSFAYAREMIAPGSSQVVSNESEKKQKAVEQALKQWNSSSFHSGEGENSANQICFSKEPMNDPSFSSLALEIYQPFFKAIELESN